MRIDRLDLTRFGIFTDESLDLSDPGLHVVVGANETGKTTAMMAIRQLLFGIPERTTHAFAHEMKDLRVGAAVSSGSVDRFEIVRLKKRKDPLQDPAGHPLDGEQLARLLHGVDAEIFSSLFTIAHDEIAAGGEALLATDGEVGKAIFSASRGTADLTAVLQQLDDRAGAIFKSGGSKPHLNAAIRDYKDERNAANELSRHASVVTDLDRDLLAATDAHDELAEKRKAHARRINLLGEIQSNRPRLASRRDHLSTCAKLEAPGRLVDPGLGDDLDAARGEREKALNDRRAAARAIERLDEKLEPLNLDVGLLEQSEAIEQLRGETGSYRERHTDLPGLETTATTLRRELDELRRDLPSEDLLDDSGRPTLSVAQRATVDELAARRGGLATSRDHAGRELEMARAALAELRTEPDDLGEPADVGSLLEVCSRLRKHGDLEADRSGKLRRLTRLESDLDDELHALGVTGVEPTDVGSLSVPTSSAIREARTVMVEVESEAGTAESAIEDLAARLEVAEHQLRELLGGDRPPSIDELEAARRHREAGWRLIRASWLGDADVDGALGTWADGLPPDRAYEAAVGSVDDIADRLREDADAVARRTALEAEIEQLKVASEARREQLDVIRSRQDTAEASWLASWEPVGLTPTAPAEMESWRDAFGDCVQQAKDCRGLKVEVDELQTDITRHRNDLTGSLALAGIELPEDLSLSALLEHAEAAAAREREAQRKVEEGEKAVIGAQELITQREEELRAAETAMQDWERQWSAAVSLLGLPETALPEAARAVLTSLNELMAKRSELDRIEGRIEGIERRNTGFDKQVAAVVTLLTDHPDAAGLDPDAAATLVGQRLDAAKEVAATRAATVKERDDQTAIRDEADAGSGDAEATIARLVESAGVDDEEALSDAIARSTEHAELKDEVTKIEEDLRRSTGKAIDVVVAEAGAVEDIDIAAELDELRSEAEDIDRELKQRAERLGELRKERSLIDASGEAAGHMELAQQSLAEVVDHADDYVRTMLAKRLLEEQIADYREEHQGPLLDRAGTLFSALTLDRYAGIDTDTDDGGRPLLRARRADDRLVGVDELSTGTRDQLYLSLRLAALEQFMDRRGPLPLILDDLFVHFDDDRTEAGLRVLDDLADETQVLLFTHHRQVAGQAERLIDADRLTVHEL